MHEIDPYYLSPQLDYRVDSEGILYYNDPVEKKVNTILPAVPITDPYIIIGKIGQQNLLPNHFTIKSKDFEETIITNERGIPIGEPIRPGISSFLFWGTKNSQQDNLSSMTKSGVGREVTRKNRLYITQVEDIYKAGWTPYFAPLINKQFKHFLPLHVLLVPNTFLGTLNRLDAGFVEKEAITEVFIRWDNYES